MQLVRYEQARTALAECHRVDEVKDIRDKAEAMAAYARQAKDTELIQYATEIKVRAERRCGELLAKTERNKGATVKGRMAVERYDTHSPTLEDMGLTRDESSRYQQLAAMPDEHFETAVATAKATVGEVTTSFMLREAKKSGAQSTEGSNFGPARTKDERATRFAQISRMFAEGYTPQQVADELGIANNNVHAFCKRNGITIPQSAFVSRGSRGNNVDPLRIIDESVSGLTGIAQGLGMVSGVDFTISVERARDLVSEADRALRIIRKVVSQLKGVIANGRDRNADEDKANRSDDALEDPDGAAREDASLN